MSTRTSHSSSLTRSEAALMTEDDDRRVRRLAEEFATELTQLVHATVGPEAAPFVAMPVSGRRQVWIRQEPATGIQLPLADDSVLVILARFVGRLSASKQHLRIRKSAFEVSYADADGEPMFRYEYDATMTRRFPRAHLQVHESQNLAALAAVSGDGTRIARQRAARVDRGKRVFRAEDLHFPLGGDRFRPALEDILQFLIEQLGVRAVEGYHDAINAGRRLWRHRQLAAAVGDNAEVAATALEALGYTVRAPVQGHTPARSEHLDAL